MSFNGHAPDRMADLRQTICPRTLPRDSRQGNRLRFGRHLPAEPAIHYYGRIGHREMLRKAVHRHSVVKRTVQFFGWPAGWPEAARVWALPTGFATASAR